MAIEERWRAWYFGGDGVQEYTSAQMDWASLPDGGLQVVKIYELDEWKPGRPYTRQLDGKDWYYRAPDGRIEGVRSTGWDGYGPRPCCVPDIDIKRGTAVSNELFDNIVKLAGEAVTWA